MRAALGSRGLRKPFNGRVPEQQGGIGREAEADRRTGLGRGQVGVVTQIEAETLVAHLCPHAHDRAQEADTLNNATDRVRACAVNPAERKDLWSQSQGYATVGWQILNRLREADKLAC